MDPKPKKKPTIPEIADLIARPVAESTGARRGAPAYPQRTMSSSLPAANTGRPNIPLAIPQDEPGFKERTSPRGIVRGTMENLTAVPGLGDLVSLGIAGAEAARGHPGTAALYGLAGLPLITPAMTKGAAKVARLERLTEWSRPHAEEMARIYESLPKHDPAAAGAYAAMVREVDDQFEQMKRAGIRVEFTDADPYRTSKEMMADVRENKRLKVFKTSEDHGHPFLTREQNDKFRAVHDYFGHAQEGHQFGPLGEENAYRVHSEMFSPEARRAMATETRGQNSWFNAGPHSYKPPKERPFAEQKGALWPETHLGEYSPGVPSVAARGEARTQKLLDDLNKAGWTGRTERRVADPSRMALPDGVERRQIKASELPDTRKAGKGLLGETLDRLKRWNSDLGEAGKLSFGRGVVHPSLGVDLYGTRTARAAGEAAAFDYAKVGGAPGVLTPSQTALPRQVVKSKAKLAPIADLMEQAYKNFGKAEKSGVLARGVDARAHDWWDMDVIAQEFVDRLGPVEGLARFSKMADLLAATSASSDAASNVARAQVLFPKFISGGLDPAVLKRSVNSYLPEGIGTLAGSTQGHMVKQVMAGEPFSAKQAKVAAMAENIRGNYEPATIDRHIVRTATGDMDAGPPQGISYNPIEQALRMRANEALVRGDLPVPAGRSPVAPYQAGLWVGNAKATGVQSDARPLAKVFGDQLEHFARQHGISSREMMDRLVQADPTLFSGWTGTSTVRGPTARSLGPQTDLGF